MIRVVIIADRLLRAESLAKFLAEDEQLEIVDVRAVSRFESPVQTGPADVVVSIGLPLDLTSNDGPPVVALGDAAPEELPFGRALRAWLPTNSSPSEVAAAVVAAANDLTALTQTQVRQWLRPAPAHEEDPVAVEMLTSREIQVLRMLADGFGNKEIAGQLGISDHTAKFHVAQILAKLGAASRTEAVAIGIRRGLVPI